MNTLPRLPVLQGLPDDMSGAVSLDEAGKLQLSLPGTAVFLMHLPASAQARMPRVYVQPGKPVRLPADAYCAKAYPTPALALPFPALMLAPKTITQYTPMP